jgi:hypothetical protein
MTGVSETLQQIIIALLDREQKGPYNNASELRAALFVHMRYLEHAATHGKKSVGAYSAPSQPIMLAQPNASKKPAHVTQISVTEQVVSAGVAPQPRKVSQLGVTEQVVSAEVDYAPTLPDNATVGEANAHQNKLTSQSIDVASGSNNDNRLRLQFDFFPQEGSMAHRSGSAAPSPRGPMIRGACYMGFCMCMFVCLCVFGI